MRHRPTVHVYANRLPANQPLARKRHRCALCSSPILPGCQYGRWTALEDSPPVSMAAHLACLALVVDGEDLGIDNDGLCNPDCGDETWKTLEAGYGPFPFEPRSASFAELPELAKWFAP